uniref:Uncharacterized protein n=1 Tax=Romanomermis culicivorax TaxID=13658 RepID=A0A915KCG7_ROMCU
MALDIPPLYAWAKATEDSCPNNTFITASDKTIIIMPKDQKHHKQKQGSQADPHNYYANLRKNDWLAQHYTG